MKYLSLANIMFGKFTADDSAYQHLLDHDICLVVEAMIW